MKTIGKTKGWEFPKTRTDQMGGLQVVGILVTAIIMVSDGSYGAAASAAKVVIYPAPAGEVLSADYEVHAEGQKVDVYIARVLDPPFAGKRWDHGGSYSFANFDMSGRVEVRIVSKQSLRNVVIRPQSSRIQSVLVDDHTLKLTLDQPRKISVEPEALGITTSKCCWSVSARQSTYAKI